MNGLHRDDKRPAMGSVVDRIHACPSDHPICVASIMLVHVLVLGVPLSIDSFTHTTFRAASCSTFVRNE